MGGLLSTPSTNPSEAQTTAMSSKEEASQTPELKRTQNESSEAQNPETQEPIDPAERDPEEEEEGECGFCLFMKGGGCRDSFVAWEKCIEEAEKNQEDIVDKCFEVTGALKKCMEAHSDYYGPILQAEKAAEVEAVRELENEKAKESGSSSSSGDSEERLSAKGSDQGDSKGSEKNEGS